MTPATLLQSTPSIHLPSTTTYLENALCQLGWMLLIYWRKRQVKPLPAGINHLGLSRVNGKNGTRSPDWLEASLSLNSSPHPRNLQTIFKAKEDQFHV